MFSSEVHKIISEVKTQIENRKREEFFSLEVNMSLENFTDAEQQIVIKEFSTVYDRLLQYLASIYNFSDNNIFKNISVLDISNSSLFSINDLVNVANKLHVMFDGN